MKRLCTNTRLLSLTLLLLVYGFTRGQNQSTATLYLGQTPPHQGQQLFAPGLISLKEQYEFGSVFSRDGNEFYFAVELQRGKPFLQYCKRQNGQWTKPQTLLTHEQYSFNDPFLSPDQQRLYFISDQPLNGKGPKKDVDIWFIQRQGQGWSEPVNAGPAINSPKNEYYVSFTSTGTMYFSSNRGTSKEQDKNYDIYTSRYEKGTFQPAQKLGSAINSEHYEADVFVAPDERYLIYCAERPDGKGQGDLWISFKDKNGAWQPAKNMGSAINTPGYDFCPFVTADGKYLFLSRDGDIYWVSAQIIQTLK
ncbi:PD40 domain-containing protein [Larkinella soli]|uniref:PD40 domain-containing protein n=1 Tax=Larkinella soli TaxID=1770527 RepID=UPI000FFBC852|nr:PD40 domain-containing protein [Larkinella soli]